MTTPLDSGDTLPSDAKQIATMRESNPSSVDVPHKTVKQRGRYSPENPSFLSTTTKARVTGSKPGAVTSLVHGDNADLIGEVAKLWIRDDDFVVDATYGKGNFWTKTNVDPQGKHDIATDGVPLNQLPYADGAADVVALDPPYRPNHGSKSSPNRGIFDAYKIGAGKVETIDDVLDLYRSGIHEAFRVVKPGGVLVVKCQDMTYGHRLHLVTIDVLTLMVRCGWDLADQFILGSKGQLKSGRWETQERARRSHSVLWVGVKP